MTLRPRVAIAHDYLTQRGGAERVVLSLLRAFPDAPVYTTLYHPDGTYPEFADANIITSGLNAVPAFRADHRRALPLLPPASSSMRIDADVVLASSSGWAHGFPASGRKVVYCHTPARFLYLTDEYLGGSAHSSLIGNALLALRPALTWWDQRAARSADVYLCNSSVVRERIEAVYGIAADVISPPAGLQTAGDHEPVPQLLDWADDYFLVVSRLMHYKNVDRVIEAFRGTAGKVVIIGHGPQRDALAADLPDNARLLQGLSDGALRWAYAHCRALIAASYEDYGLTPLEAGAFGKPCIALRAGGFLDTVSDGVNGLFFAEPTPAAIRFAVAEAGTRTWDVERIADHAAEFSETRFISRIRAVVSAQLRESGKPVAKVH